MTNDQIEKFIQKNGLDKSPVELSFKTRKPLSGIFIKTGDYAELKAKNLWRFVWESNIQDYKKSNDLSFARIFNGTEITKLNIAGVKSGSY
jgi:hypothetical protein